MDIQEWNKTVSNLKVALVKFAGMFTSLKSVDGGSKFVCEDIFKICEISKLSV